MKKEKQKRIERRKRVYVPSEILRTFKAYFNDVDLTQVEWSWEVVGKIYQAEFVRNGQEHEAEFTINGFYLCLEVEIPESELPKALRQTIEERYQGYKITGVERVDYMNGEIHYEVELDKGDNEFEILIREDGWVIAAAEDL